MVEDQKIEQVVRRRKETESPQRDIADIEHTMMLFRIQNITISLLLLLLVSFTVHVHATADNSTIPDRRAGVGHKRPVSRGKTSMLQSFPVPVGYVQLSHIMLTAFPLSLSNRQVLKLASLEAVMPCKVVTRMSSRS